jgi:TonB family protein
MSVERDPKAQPGLETDFGTLQGCFVEGNGEQRLRERGIRRRALIISIVAQSAIVATIVLFPLFGKPERIALAGNLTPIPPYYHNSAPPRSDPPTEHRTTIRHFCPTCFSPHFPQHPATQVENDPPGESPQPLDPGPAIPCVGCIPLNDGRSQPERPLEVRPQTKRVVMTRLEPAMLIYRVEPIYPALARQTRLEGKVELRAIIATDGTIQSLQVVSGHPLFIQSALTAVRRWRYRATVLDAQAVEIDTYITVVYTLQH